MANITISALHPKHTLGYLHVFNTVVRERKYLLSSEQKSEHQIRQFIERNFEKNIMLVAQSNERVIGWCDIVRKIEPSQHHCGTLGIALLPSYRGKGIGRQLMQTALKQCQKQQIHRVELEVFSENTHAIKLYQQLDFHFEGEKKRARLMAGHFQNITLMAKLF